MNIPYAHYPPAAPRNRPRVPRGGVPGGAAVRENAGRGIIIPNDQRQARIERATIQRAEALARIRNLPPLYHDEM